MEGTTSFLEGCFGKLYDGRSHDARYRYYIGREFVHWMSVSEVIVSNGTTAPQTDALAFTDISTETD